MRVRDVMTKPAGDNRHAVDAQAPHAAPETRDGDRRVVNDVHSTGEGP
jgi:hypothetical protein